MNKRIGIIDFNAGNLVSIVNAFERLGWEVVVSSNPDKFLGIKKIVLPGVGSFRSAKNNLDKLGFTEYITRHVESDGHLLGICLGMQLLFESGCEGGKCDGLGLILGEVIPLNKVSGFRIPHVGWNDLVGLDELESSNILLMENNPSFYFVHSYFAVTPIKDNTIYTNYCNEKILSGIKYKNIFGYQFHPEKSQKFGIEVLKRFLEY